MIKMKVEMIKACYHDLGVKPIMADMIHWNGVILEIEVILKHFEKWAKPTKVNLGMICGPGYGSMIKPEPLGVSLVMSAWNYPYYTGIPYVAMCIAAGNCVLYKPSERAV
jgi:aldehyde dehydrogenase (NAD+)